MKLPAILKRSLILKLLLGSLTLLLLLGGAAVLLAIYWLPGFAREQAEIQLSRELLRPVHVGQIVFDWSQWAVRVKDLRIDEAPVADATGKAGVLVSFDELRVVLSTASFSQRAPIVREVHLQAPYIHLARTGPGRFNVSDVLAHFLEKPSSGPTPAFAVSNITLQQGTVVFDDAVAGEQHRVTDIDLGVPHIANEVGPEDVWVEPRFSARVNGSPLHLKGRLKPFAEDHEAVVDIDLKDLDLDRLEDYVPVPLPVKVAGARLDTRLAVSFAQNKAGPRLGVKGNLMVRQIGVASREGVPLVSLKALGLEGIDVNLATRQARVEKVVVDHPLVDIKRRKDGSWQGLEAWLGGTPVAATEAGAAAAKPPAAAPVAAKPGPRGRHAKGAKPGHPSVAASLPPSPPPAAEVAPQTSPVPTATAPATPVAEQPVAGGEAPPPSKPWTWSVGQVVIQDGHLGFEDGVLENPLPVVVEGLTLEVGAVAADFPAPIPIKLQARVNGTGKLAVEGQVDVPKRQADLNLDIQKFELVGFQGWTQDRLTVLLTKGDLGFKGRVQASPERVQVEGSAQLGEISVLDRLNASDLLRWKSLRLTGLDLALELSPERVKAGVSPWKLGIGEVSFSDFYARLLLSKEGRLNLKDVVKAPPEAGPKPGEVPPTTVPAPASPGGGESPLPIRIGKIVLSNGNVNFTDQFIKPNYSANLTQLGGTIGTLAPGLTSSVEPKAKVDGAAPVEISGAVDPLTQPLSLDLAAKAKGIEMTGLSAYSGRYVGYTIEKGKLSVDVHYKVDKGELTAENQVFLDQLTFGSKVDSPDAPSLPVTLAVALLKNSRGEIDLNLPIRGSLSDPQFSIGGIIGKAIMNLIVKAVTAPFTLLASLFSGGEDMSQVAFAPGRDGLSPAVEKHLEGLAKAMKDRPALKLDISGRASRESDGEAFRRNLLTQRVKAYKLADLASHGRPTGALDEITLTPEEYGKYLEAAFKAERYPETLNVLGFVKSFPQAEMEALMLQHMAVGEEELRYLAEGRGRVVQAWLAERGEIPFDRLFLVAPKLESGTAPGAGPGSNAGSGAEGEAGNRVVFALH